MASYLVLLILSWARLLFSLSTGFAPSDLFYVPSKSKLELSPLHIGLVVLISRLDVGLVVLVGDDRLKVHDWRLPLHQEMTLTIDSEINDAVRAMNDPTWTNSLQCESPIPRRCRWVQNVSLVCIMSCPEILYLFVGKSLLSSQFLRKRWSYSVSLCILLMQ